MFSSTSQSDSPIFLAYDTIVVAYLENLIHLITMTASLNNVSKFNGPVICATSMCSSAIIRSALGGEVRQNPIATMVSLGLLLASRVSFCTEFAA